MKKITIGARGSKLSLAYVEKVKNLILEKSKDLNDGNFVIKTIKTSGDIHSDIKLSEIGGKNLFCKEIEENLLENNIDIAVHSLKDMESEQNESLMIGAYVKRNDPRDVLICNKIKNFNELSKGATIGSSSRRRELQLKKINDTQTSLCAVAEREMLQTIGGDCETAIGGLAEITNNNLILKAQLFSDEGDESFDYKFTGRDVDAANIGKTVGEKLLNLAGKKFKKR